MRALRFWFVAILGWFFLFYNIERFSEPINIASFMYVFSAILAVLVIFLSEFQFVSMTWLLASMISLFFILKVWFGYELGGRNLPLTVTEICAIGITTVLAMQVGRGLAEFREAVFQVVTSHLKNSSQPFDIDQGAMYREVRRARMHQHPVAVLAIAASDDVAELPGDRFIEEMQRNSIKKYINARIADLLSEEMNAYDLIAQRNGHFVTMLPGVDRHDAYGVAQKLENLAKEKLGLNLSIGIATFPEEVTFEKLVTCAEHEMKNGSIAVINKQSEEVSQIEAALLWKKEL